MSDLRQQLPSSRHRMLRHHLEYHGIANSPRRIAYAVAGALLAQGAPTGLLHRKFIDTWRNYGVVDVMNGPSLHFRPARAAGLKEDQCRICACAI
jgi:hypothetical protein